MIQSMTLKEQFIRHLVLKYPDLSNHDLQSLVSDHLLALSTVKLPLSVLDKIKSDIQIYNDLRHWGDQHLIKDYEKYGLRKPDNLGVCNSFDYHVVDNEKIKLIEMNTNAAFLALGLELYDFYKKTTHTDFNSQSLADMFKTDAAKAGIDLQTLTIMDDKPSEQRLFIEFLVFKSLLEKNNLNVDIKDISEKQSGYIYNRYTDFYLSEDKSATLKQQFNDQDIQLSPNPYEYFLLADKKRMLDWQNQTDIKCPDSLLKIYDLGKEDKDYIWSQRKNLFFKPKNSFGSKQVYKGHGISRGMFDSFYGESMIAQELAPPSETSITLPDNTSIKMKYDLRCYAYDGHLQLVIARLYQGQTTNLKTFGGGFAIVEFQ